MRQHAPGSGHKQKVKRNGKVVPNHWRLVVELGADPETGKRLQDRPYFEGTAAQADRELRRLKGLADSGHYVIRNDTTVEEWLDLWLKEYAPISRAGSTVTGYKGKTKCYLKPELGKIVLQKLRPEMIQAMINKMYRPKDAGGRGLSGSTIRQTHAILHLALSQAVKNRLIPFNPSASGEGIELPPLNRFEPHVMTVAEAHDLMNKLGGGDLYLPIALMLNTGMRRGEALSLAWEDVDLLEGTIRVRRAWDMDENATGGYVLRDRPKSPHSVRTIELPHSVVELLCTAKDEFETRQEARGERYTTVELPEQRGVRGHLIFCLEDGSPWFPNKFSNEWGEFRKKHKIVARMHDLRHTHLTWMAERKHNPTTIKERAGHYSAAYTMDRYVHPDRETHRRLADDMDMLLGYSGPHSGPTSAPEQEDIPSPS